MGSEPRPHRSLGTAFVLLATVASAVPVAAHPPAEPDHGVNESTFATLWSGDEDGNLTGHDGTGGAGAPIRQLAAGTDVPLDEPPIAAERWNDGDHGEFPSTGPRTAVRPAGVETETGRFVRDAHATIFAVQPSTRARLSSSRQPLYVASDGEVLGTVDYRMTVPADDTSGSRQVYWSLENHAVSETRLLVDGDEAANGGRSHTPTLSFSDLDDYVGERHTLTLEADVEVRLRKHVRTVDRECRTVRDGTNASGTKHTRRVCTRDVDHEYHDVTETVTVSDSRDVVEYDLQVSGFRAQFPDGDLGLVVYKSDPWLGHTLPTGQVQGVWRFYSARDPTWDTLVRSTENGSSRTHSPLHPLQVNAYPIETGPTATGSAELQEVYGVETEPPTLPANVTLDAVDESYTASYGIATRSDTQGTGVSTVRARGLVRGIDVEADESDFASVPIHRSNLTLTVANATAGNTTVRVRLRDEKTGGPINTVSRGGSVAIAGERVNTTGNGTATVTVDGPSGSVSARYEPGNWWRHSTGYTGDSAVVTTQGPVLHVVAAVFRFAVPVGLLMLALYLVDKVTQWRTWPPWKGL